MNPKPLLFSKNPMYDKIFSAMKKFTAGSDVKVYLVGGAVRDIIRGDLSNDLDFVVFNENYLSFAKRVAKNLNRQFISFKDNVRIPCGGGYIDISSPRGGSLAEDLSKRDFTVNNLAMDLEGTIIGDPSDIDNRIIRPVYEKLFYDDPLRILRGFRQSALLNYKLSDEFFVLAADAVPELVKVAGERIFYEMKLLSAAETDAEIYESMSRTGVWKSLFDFEPNLTVMLRVMTGADVYGEEGKFVLFLAALLAENENRASLLLNRLCVSNSMTKSVTTLLKQSAAICSAALCEMGKIIWRWKGSFSMLLYYASIRYDLSEEHISKYTAFAASFNRNRAEAVNGDIMLQLIEKFAPDKAQGQWMSALLEETKIKLASNELKDREDAERYMSLRIKRFIQER